MDVNFAYAFGATLVAIFGVLAMFIFAIYEAKQK